MVVIPLLGHPRGLVAEVVGVVLQLAVMPILQMTPWWVDGVLQELEGVGVGSVPGLQVGLQLELLLLLVVLQVGLVPALIW